MADILKKHILIKDITLKITDFTPGAFGRLLVKQDNTGGWDVLLPADLVYRGDVIVTQNPHDETLIRWNIDDAGVLFNVSYPNGGGGGTVDLTNYYTKAQTGNLFYPLTGNPSNFLTSQSNLYWENISNKPITLSGYGLSMSDTLFDNKYSPIDHTHTTLTGLTVYDYLTIPNQSTDVINSIWISNEIGSTGYTPSIVANLNDLSDVNLLTPSNGQALVYQNGLWLNQNIVTSLTNYWDKSESDSRYYPLTNNPANYLTSASTLPWGSVTGKPSFFDGNYNSLSNKPTSLSQFTNNLGNYGNWITQAQGNTFYSLVNHTHSYSEITGKPTNLSFFTNDLGNFGNWVTKAQGDTYYPAISGYNKSNWDTAYSWGNHASVGYLTSESDTLQTVTNRGASTNANVSFNGSLVIPSNSSNQINSIWISDTIGSTGYTPSIVANLNDLSDVNITSASSGQALVFNGSNWINQSVVTDLSNYYTKTQSDLVYAYLNGSNVTGTWGINISGNANSATNWGGYTADFTQQAGNPTEFIAWDSNVAAYRALSISGMKSTLGLNNGSALNNISADSTLWRGYDHNMNSVISSTAPTYLMGVTGAMVSKHTVGSMQSWLGLGSNAYQSFDNFHYETFTADANTLASNRSAFTYANNAPYTGPIAHFGADGYGLQVNASYGSGGQIGFRTRNGDGGYGWNNWHRLLTDTDLANETLQSVTNRGNSTGLGGASGNYLNFSPVSGGKAFAIYMDSGGWYVRNTTDNTYPFNIATNGNATFTGNVVVNAGYGVGFKLLDGFSITREASHTRFSYGGAAKMSLNSNGVSISSYLSVNAYADFNYDVNFNNYAYFNNPAEFWGDTSFIIMYISIKVLIQ